MLSTVLFRIGNYEVRGWRWIKRAENWLPKRDYEWGSHPKEEQLLLVLSNHRWRVEVRETRRHRMKKTHIDFDSSPVHFIYWLVKFHWFCIKLKPFTVMYIFLFVFKLTSVFSQAASLCCILKLHCQVQATLSWIYTKMAISVTM